LSRILEQILFRNFTIWRVKDVRKKLAKQIFLEQACLEKTFVTTNNNKGFYNIVITKAYIVRIKAFRTNIVRTESF